MRCLIVGYGSIGRRHAKILKDLGCQVELVTSQKVNDFSCYSSIANALEKKIVDYVVIANATHVHYNTLLTLIQLDYQGILLVEKPLFSKLKKLPKNKIKKIFVAYNLRFNELLAHAKKIIETEKLISFSAYVGQYLPTWRKDSDYRNCYSAKKDHGGGVLRDLSHEIDYSTWLCGPGLELTARGGQFSDLEINSDDVYSIMLRTISCPIVNLQLNYLDRYTRREIIINTKRNTIFIDLIKGLLMVDSEIKIQAHDALAQSYIHQHRALLNQQFTELCSYEEGLKIMQLIEAVEAAAVSQSWITL